VRIVNKPMKREHGNERSRFSEAERLPSEICEEDKNLEINYSCISEPV